MANEHTSWAQSLTDEEIRALLPEAKGQYEALRDESSRRREEYMDNLVEKQSTGGFRMIHSRLGQHDFKWEFWLVKRERQYRIVGTSVYVIEEKGDDLYGQHHRPGCELCPKWLPWAIQGYEHALESAYVHWLEEHHGD